MKSVRLVYATALVMGLEGCATILGGSNQTITVNSNVAGADVFLNEQLLGKTPLVTNIKRGQEGVFRVRADGYQPYQMAVNKKINNLFWVNIFTGGTFGSSTDYGTGAMYEYEPSTFMVSLQPGRSSLEQRNDWRRKEGLRGFLLINGDALVSNLAAGNGEYLDVLVDVFGVSPEGRVKAIERWRAEYARSKTAAEFADRMVAGLSQN